jgi:hypothetical protein
LKGSLWQPLQKRLKNDYGICKVDGLDICAEISESTVMTDVDCKERAIQDDNPMRSDTDFEFVKGMLTNDEIDTMEQEKEAKLYVDAKSLSENQVELESGADVVDARMLDEHVLCKRLDDFEELVAKRKISSVCY